MLEMRLVCFGGEARAPHESPALISHTQEGNKLKFSVLGIDTPSNPRFDLHVLLQTPLNNDCKGCPALESLESKLKMEFGQRLSHQLAESSKVRL